MKKLVIFFTTATLLTACGGNADKNTSTETPTATSPTNDMQAQEQADIERAKKETIDSINLSTIRQRTIDSMNGVALIKESEHKNVTHHTAHHAAGSAPGTVPATQPQASGNGQVATSTPAAPVAAPTPTVAKKKGLNNAVKGALIGLGTGVAAGAVIDKNNRGQGAIIGGILGASGGAIGGAVIDKNKRKKAKQDSINAANGQ